MIKVTADIFSGRPNPQWIVSGAEAATALRALSQQPAAAANLDSGFQGLGNRGLIVEVLNDHSQDEYGVPAIFRLAGSGSSHESHARETAERLIAALTAHGAGDHPLLTSAEGALPLDADLMRFILGGLPAARGPLTHSAEQAETIDSASSVSATAACLIETTLFNPGFWNDPAHISRNNCYNYATNRRTDTFAQPGRASGHMYAHINCADVGNGAVSDGGTFACAPDSQKNRWYMALVIAPGPGFIDYHWYRKATQGFWGHKPGGTAARNVDNAGRVVVDPRTANRGPYTIFCRFMFAQKKMVVR
ncbi:MAG: hypothetical protein HYR88_10130 [Verrucomicrobia bacterium]|nr:hypothetical protein [Verrucomicrobiota bacterium]MBI3870886.1 hypothetical protein [Verrucomicrobiota bacterium]